VRLTVSNTRTDDQPIPMHVRVGRRQVIHRQFTLQHDLMLDLGPMELIRISSAQNFVHDTRSRGRIQRFSPKLYTLVKRFIQAIHDKEEVGA
jgi:hypothetical protein